MLPFWRLTNSIKQFSGLVLLTPLALFVATAPAMGALGDVGFQVNIAEKEMILENPGDMGVKMFASWDVPFQRIADRNMPFVEVMNCDDSTGNLTEFRITIGDEDYNFADDFFGAYTVLGDSTPGIDISSIAPTGDELIVTFGNGGLAPGELVRFRIDLNPDPGIDGLFPHPDFRTVLFDMNDMDEQGMSDNAIVTGRFEDPNDNTMTAIVSGQLPDYTVTGPQAQYFNQNIRPNKVMEGVDIFDIKVTTVIPEPSTVTLCGVALVAAGLWRGRRSRV